MTEHRCLLRTLPLVAALLVAAQVGGDEENPYTGFSDKALSELAGDWQSLDQDKRRWLFIEVRKRMATGESHIEIPVSQQSRFGRAAEEAGDPGVWMRDADAIQAEPAHLDDGDYGHGFERRAQEPEGRHPPPPKKIRAREMNASKRR